MPGASVAVIIRVGDGALETGMLDGFDNNLLCALKPEGLDLANPLLIECSRPVSGRYVSIQVVDPVEPVQLKLCDIDIITA